MVFSRNASKLNRCIIISYNLLARQVSLLTKHCTQSLYPFRNDLLVLAVCSIEQFRERSIAEVEIHALPEGRVYRTRVARQHTLGELPPTAVVKTHEIHRGIANRCVAPINHPRQNAALWITEDMFAGQVAVDQHGLKGEDGLVIQKILPQPLRFRAQFNILQQRKDALP